MNWWVVWQEQVGNRLVLPTNCWRWDRPLQANSHSSPALKLSFVMLPKVCSLWWPKKKKKKVEINGFKKISNI